MRENLSAARAAELLMQKDNMLLLKINFSGSL